MFKLEIKKQEVITDRVVFETLEELNSYVLDRAEKAPFGLPERPEFDELGEPTGNTLPCEFEVVITEIIPTYAELRKIQYAKRVDPLLSEALTDKEAGDSAAMTALLAVKAAIKLEIPRPE